MAVATRGVTRNWLRSPADLVAAQRNDSRFFMKLLLHLSLDRLEGPRLVLFLGTCRSVAARLGATASSHKLPCNRFCPLLPQA